ncbi:DoxX family protein [Echinicola vietnamensis]|uniref:Putative membrane protein n=1 Tax=Echinicola vietnamensis (strain DSM 17526 / LMG 23754 / KMM 6221) TaxID=926556 RepID=L0G374_ECHVK|nr:DoxX family protein [Echinicola vietnamensis]AGA80674.1 putative membrane protein [Echinicola vietnamensis DSM 17526]
MMNGKYKYGYFFLRLPIAMSLLGHGLVRLPKLQGFSNWMVGLMQNSYLPKPMILGFSYVVPFVEVFTGLFLLIGLFTRQTIYVALTLMALFIFGNTTIENWEPITSQLVHAGYLGMLIMFIQHNDFSLDSKLKK